ncbi:response regulator transcription factor [Chitinophaga ginsengisoli]|uniref:DNA-binding response OmpR family regulator n=1 Tax=Chitinophaga ginsengisoli TaxID=363837 RepID=A0A2P8FDZ4_9BACT|nr:response regulator transcription factor [Chitinophaga ginsengisoli]PSL19936.1 DNA-binding response OmpR family regulator [Chitinophaga ginsengisoli]
MKLLIIDGDLALSQVMISYLSDGNYICEYANNYQRALSKIEMYQYDCILLDLVLPDGDGNRLLEAIKANNKMAGIIVISAKTAYEDKISALENGADDYVTKPFHLPELSARIFSVIRRMKYDNCNVIRQEELTIDLLGKTVQINNNPVSLTRKEFDLLLYFLGNKNKVISKHELAEQLSGDIAGLREDNNVIYAHIKNLKKKLHEAGAGNYLKTIYATGYKWEA